MITQTLATWIAGMCHADVPLELRTTLRYLTRDTFGVALTGWEQPWTKAIRAWSLAGGVPETGRARLWGEAVPRLRAADAALVNGAAAHAFELDDFHNAKLHPGAVVVPTAFAVGESINASSERIETAIAVGYEVMIRTSLALKPASARLRGWHLTAVCGPLGAAAATSVLLGLDAERTRWALGLAGTQSGGLFAFAADGTDSKRLHPGRAAHAGIMAAEMAALGLTGPTCIYEAADGGLLKAFSDDSDPQALVTGLGQLWYAADTNIKPYACCGSVHAHVDAALALRARWKDGRRVRAGMARIIDIQCGYDYHPSTALNAQMSARYCIAIALIDGAVQPVQFDSSRIVDPEVVALAAKIEIVQDTEHNRLYPKHFCGWIEVETEDGRFERKDVLDPSGSPQNPERNNSARAKFDALVTSVLPPSRVAALQHAFDKMDDTPLSTLLDYGILQVADEQNCTDLAQ